MHRTAATYQTALLWKPWKSVPRLHFGEFCVVLQYVCVFQIAADVRTAKRELKKAQTVLQMDKLKCRKRVLRRLGFASPSDVIEMKGRVACEISR